MAATPAVVDLSNVKEGGNFRPKRKPAGDYRGKIVKADDHTSKAGDAGWVLTIQVDGDARSSYPYYLSKDPKSAWKVGAICRAAGLNVKNVRVRFDPNKLVNKAIGMALDDDEYEGRLKSTIEDVFPVSEIGANADEDVPEGDEVIDDEEDAESDEAELDDEPEPEPSPPPRRRRKPAPEPEPEPEDDEDGDYEDEEPEPEPAPKRRRAAAPTKAAAPPRKRAAKPAPVEDDDDDDLDLDDLDEV